MFRCIDIERSKTYNFDFASEKEFSDVNRPAGPIDFWGKKSQISSKLVQNFPKRASRFNKGSKLIEKNKKVPQKVSKKVQKLQKWS
jgi:hypothetical protein